MAWWPATPWAVWEWMLRKLNIMYSWGCPPVWYTYTPPRSRGGGVVEAWASLVAGLHFGGDIIDKTNDIFRDLPLQAYDILCYLKQIVSPSDCPSSTDTLMTFSMMQMCKYLNICPDIYYKCGKYKLKNSLKVMISLSYYQSLPLSVSGCTALVDWGFWLQWLTLDQGAVRGT